jgi:hypothetical protein
MPHDSTQEMAGEYVRVAPRYVAGKSFWSLGSGEAGASIYAADVIKQLSFGRKECACSRSEACCRTVECLYVRDACI